MSKVEAGELVTTAAHIYAYSSMVSVLGSFMCPKTGVFDLRGGAPIVDGVYDRLIEWGIPKDHMKIIVAYAINDLQEVHALADRLSPGAVIAGQEDVS